MSRQPFSGDVCTAEVHESPQNGLGGTRRRRLGLAVALATLVLALAACSDGSDDAAAPDAGDTSASAPAGLSVPDAPPASAPGTGVVVVGGTSNDFDVTSCRLEADPSEPEGARTLVAIAGEGTTGTGVPFTVQVQRFATGTDVQTFTDTLLYSDSGRILQAQRIEVNGQVTDLRDPDATSALLRVRADGVSASGIASGPGDDQEDGGLIGIALDATC